MDRSELRVELIEPGTRLNAYAKTPGFPVYGIVDANNQVVGVARNIFHLYHSRKQAEDALYLIQKTAYTVWSMELSTDLSKIETTAFDPEPETE